MAPAMSFFMNSFVIETDNKKPFENSNRATYTLTLLFKNSSTTKTAVTNSLWKTKKLSTAWYTHFVSGKGGIFNIPHNQESHPPASAWGPTHRMASSSFRHQKCLVGGGWFFFWSSKKRWMDTQYSPNGGFMVIYCTMVESKKKL